MLDLILLITLTGLLLYYFLRSDNYWNDRNVPYKKPKSWYGIGLNFGLKLRPMTDMVNEIYRQFNDKRYFGIKELGSYTLFIKDPELIKQIAVKDFDHFVDHRPFIDPEADRLWSRNILNLQGDEWRKMRATLSPSFTSSKMKAMFHLMSECADTFIDYFKNHPEELKCVDIKDVFSRYTADMIATIAFGVKCDSLTHRNNDFYLMVKEAANVTGFWRSLTVFVGSINVKLTKIFHLKLFPTRVANFFTELIEETIKTRKEKKIKRQDMLQLLMECGKGKQQHDESNGLIDTGFATAKEHLKPIDAQQALSMEDITAQAVLFILGGYDNQSSLMQYFAYELAVNPDVQKKLIEEIDDTRTECNGKLTYEALMKMKYMDMVVTEILRKYPMFPITNRICTKPYTLQAKYPDEKPVYLQLNDVIWFPNYSIHYDEQYYPNPNKFDPERFNDENKLKIKPYTYIPFGVGPRNCIGSRFALLESKILFFHLLSNFELKVTSKTQVPLKYLKGSFAIKPERSVMLELIQRNVEKI